MKTQVRKFIPGVVNHCYQNTSGGFLLFYTVSDFLVFFTIFSSVSHRRRVRVLKLCLMYDHIHVVVIAESIDELNSFVRDYTSAYTREFHRFAGTGGMLFNKSYGSAPKRVDKAVRSTLIYSDNNPVERKLVAKAEEYRWNFLAFTNSSHPFSERLVLRQSSKPLRSAICEVKARYSVENYLPYAMLQRLFARLNREEKQQLTDYIINTYSVIDHGYSIEAFGSYEDELTAVHSTTGSEYDIKEVFVGRDDRIYGKMTAMLLGTGRFQDIHEVLSLPDSQKMDLIEFLISRLAVTPEQAAKYLHVAIRQV